MRDMCSRFSEITPSMVAASVYYRGWWKFENILRFILVHRKLKLKWKGLLVQIHNWIYFSFNFGGPLVDLWMDYCFKMLEREIKLTLLQCCFPKSRRKGQQRHCRPATVFLSTKISFLETSLDLPKQIRKTKHAK